MLLYDNPVSGNCYKVRLILGLLGIEFERRQLSVVDHSDRAGVLGGLSPSLNVPTVVLEDGRPLAESNAILWYFADGSRYLPDDPYERAQVLQWMFFEQYSHEPYIATSRFLLQHRPDTPERAAALAVRRDGGWAALKVMEGQLSKHDFFVGGYSIADIALFAYTQVSHEGGFPLDDFPKIRAWMERVMAQPGFISLMS